MTAQEWKETVLKKYLEREKLPSAELRHLEDWLKHATPKLSARLSVSEALKKSVEWTIKINEANKNLKNSGKVEEVVSFNDGLRWVRLCGSVSKKWEGSKMGHCVASYTSHQNIYSLRDKDHNPRLTMEIYRGEVAQIQGKANSTPSLKYLSHVKEFLRVKSLKMDTRELASIFGCRTIAEETLKVLNQQYSDLKYIDFGPEYQHPMFTEKTQLKNKMSFNSDVLQKMLEDKRYDLAAQMLKLPGPLFGYFHLHHMGFLMERILFTGQVELFDLLYNQPEYAQYRNQKSRFIYLGVNSGSWELVDHLLSKICRGIEHAEQALCFAAREGFEEMCKAIFHKYVPNPRPAIKSEVLSASASSQNLFNFFYSLGYREEGWRVTLLNMRNAEDLTIVKHILSNYTVSYSVLSTVFTCAMIDENFALADLLIAHNPEAFKKDNIFYRLKHNMVAMDNKGSMAYLDLKLSASNS